MWQRSTAPDSNTLTRCWTWQPPASLPACQLGRANDLARSQTDRLEMLPLRRELIVQLAMSASLQEKARSSIYDGQLVNRLEVGSLGLGVPIHLSSADFELLQQTCWGCTGLCRRR